jgi:anti-anti-sigma factor
MEEPTGKVRAKRGRTHDPAITAVPSVRLHPGRSGEWMEASAMRTWAMEQLELCQGKPVGDLVLDLEGLEYLDASALQVLLAMDAEQNRRGGILRLEHISDGLQQWFDYAGAAGLPGLGERKKEAVAESQAHA